METWMRAVMVIEAAMVSFLMALWISWMSLRGLFRLLPATKLNAVPIRAVPQRTPRSMDRHAA
jgi:hypothetical protein